MRISWNGNKDFIKHSDPFEESSFPFIVLGNKWDLTEDREVRIDEAKQSWEENGSMLYMETSAKNNVGVEEAFTTIMRKALVNEKNTKIDLPNHIKITREQNGGREQSDSIRRTIKKKKKCC